MILLHNIGTVAGNSNYNTIEEILASTGPISFDGVYENVWRHRHELVGKDITLFVMGKYVGGDNSFDVGQPLERLCSWAQIHDIMEVTGAKLGWHSWSHPDLTTVPDEVLHEEVTPPTPMDIFAYPYGRFDARVLEAVKEAGFTEAYGVFEGDGSDFQKTRRYLNH